MTQAHPRHRRRPRRLRSRLADRRAPACRWCCTRCGPVRGTEAHKTDGLAELVCSNSFRSDDAEANAVGLLHQEMRRLGSLIMRARATPIRCRPAARSRSTATASRTRSRRRSKRTRSSRSSAARSPACRRRNGTSVIVATGPLTSPALAEAIRRAHRRDRARLLRRHRADRPPRIDRHGRRLVPVALRQGRAGRHRRRLHQLPARPRTVRGLRRRAARRRQDELQGVGSDDALFRRLPADRGDGRARPRDAAPRADEAGRARPTRTGPARSPTPSSSCARTTRSARCSTWSASRPS